MSTLPNQSTDPLSLDSVDAIDRSRQAVLLSKRDSAHQKLLSEPDYKTIKPLTVDKDGNIRFTAEDSGLLNLIGLKLRRSASETFKDREIPLWKRFFFDIPTQIAHEVNESAMRDLALFEQFEGLYKNQTSGNLTNRSDITGDNLSDYLKPELQVFLTDKGFDFDHLKKKDLDDAQRIIRHFIIEDRINENIKSSTSNFLEGAASGLTVFAGGFVDPTLPVSLGAGAVGKKLATGAVKRILDKEGAGFFAKNIDNIAQRFSRNGTLTGAIVDSPFTQSHAVAMLGVDAAVGAAVADAIAQKSEFDTFEFYYGDLESSWWSPARTGIAVGLGWAIGAGLGRLFGVGNAVRQRNKDIAEITNKIDPTGNLEAYTRRVATLQELQARSLTGDVAKRPFTSEEQVLIDDAINTVTQRYDLNTEQETYRGKLVRKGEYLRQRIANIIKSDPVQKHDAEVRQLNKLRAVYDEAESEIRRLQQEVKSLQNNLETYQLEKQSVLKRSDDVIDADIKFVTDRLIEISDRLGDVSTIHTQLEKNLTDAMADFNRRYNDNVSIGRNKLIQSNAQITQRQRSIEAQIARFLANNPTYKEALAFIDSLDPEVGRSLNKVTEAYIKFDEVDKQLTAAQSKYDATPDGPEKEIAGIEVQLLQNEYLQQGQHIKVLEGRADTFDTKVNKAVELQKQASTLWQRAENTKNASERTQVLKRAHKSLQEAGEILDQVKAETTDILENDKGGPVSLYIQQLEDLKLSPVNQRTKAQQVAWLHAHYLQHGGSIALYNNTFASKVLNNPIINSLSSLLTSRNEFEKAAKSSEVFLSVVNLLDNLTSTAKVFDYGRGHVPTIQSKHESLNALIVQNLRDPMTNLVKRFGYGDELNTATKKALQLAGGIPVVTDDPAIKALADGVRTLFDNLGVRGVTSGVLNENIKNYVPVRFVENLSPELHEMVRKVIHQFFVDNYHYKDDKLMFSVMNSKHTGLMDRTLDGKSYIAKDTLRFIDETGKLVKEKEIMVPNRKGVLKPKTVNVQTFIEKYVKTFKDLEGLAFTDGTTAQSVYIKGFEGQALITESANATNARVLSFGYAEGSQANTNAGRLVGLEQAEKSQKFPHKIFLTDEILDSGAVELDPFLYVASYKHTTGAKILEQEVVNKLLDGNRSVSLDGLIEYALDDLVSKAKALGHPLTKIELDSIRDSLLDARSAIAGRSISRKENDTTLQAFASIIKNIGSTLVNAHVPVVMPATEGVMPALKNIIESGDLAFGIKTVIRSLFRSFDKEQRHAIGYTLEHMTNSNRRLLENGLVNNQVHLTFWSRAAAPFKRVAAAARGESTARTVAANPNTTRGRIKNTVVSLSETLPETTRTFSGEVPLTEMLQTMHGNYHLATVGEFTPKMAKAVKLLEEAAAKGIIIDEKVQRGIARHAGFSPRSFNLFQKYINAGLLDRNTVLDLIELKQGVKHFDDLARINDYINSQDVDTAARLRNTYERVMSFVRNEVNKNVTKPNVFDRARHQSSPLISLFNTFLSFSRGFRNGTLRDIANIGTADASALFVGYWLSEIFNSNLRAVIFQNQDADELIARWEEEPYMTALWSLQGIPIAGPMQGIAANFTAGFLRQGENPRARVGLDLLPVVNIFNNALNLASKGIHGQLTSDRDIKRASEYIPFINNAASQIVANNLLERRSQE